MSSNVLVVGLDGGTFDLLLPLVEQGHMPHLAKIISTGSWGRLESTNPPFTAVAWSSFATGKNPGKHGILSFEKSDRFHYHEKITGFNDARQLKWPLWTLMSAAGRRVAVVNVPLSYPASAVNGIMITGMMTPATAHEFTYPPELAESLEGYRIDVDFVREGKSFRRYGLPPKREMLTDIQAVTQQRTAVCQQLLQQEAWDFFMVVYTGTDRVSHFFWDDMIPIWGKHPFSTTASSPYLPELIDYFHRLDQDIEQLVVQAGPQAHVLFMSDHGFGTAPTKRFAVNLWLEQQKLLTSKSSTKLNSLAYWRMKIGRNRSLKTLMRKLLPQQIQDELAQKAQEAGGGSNIEWGKTRAYFVPIYFNVCGIELNCVDEHREGVVPSNGYDVLRTQIIAAAQQLTDPETGESMVDLVIRREDLFQGPFVGQFPDIVLVLKPEYIGGQSLAASQLVEPHVPFRSGEHRPDGIFAAIGPNIQQIADLPGLQLVDVSATVLYLLGVPVPDDFDGRTLKEIIDPIHWQANPPQYQQRSVDAEETKVKTLYSKDEETELVERLRSLGYME